MTKLETLEKQVRYILASDPTTRDDDRVLTLAVWVNIYNINPWSPVHEVLRDKALPSQESIGRVRRKIQAMDESLRGKRDKERIEAQKDFLEYAKSDTSNGKI